MVLSKKSYKIIGKYFKQQREEARLSQKKVSIELGYTTPQFVSNWERGLILPPLSTVATLIKLYSMTKNDVMTIYMAEYKKTIEQELRVKP